MSGFSLQFIWHMACIALLLYVSYTDLRERRIPNNVVLPACGIAFALMFSIPPGWQSGLIGALFGAGFLLIPAVFFGGKGGMGDVKLALFMGLILGFPGIFFALLLAHAAAAFLWIGVWLKLIERKTLIPFGPFLAIGTIIILLIPYFYTATA